MQQNGYDNSAVIFEENPYKSRELFGEKAQPLLLKLTMKTGWFRDERQAGLFIFGIVILFMLVSAILIKFTVFESTPESRALEDLTYIETTQIDPVLFQALTEGER